MSLLTQSTTERYQCPFGIISGGHADYLGSNGIPEEAPDIWGGLALYDLLSSGRT